MTACSRCSVARVVFSAVMRACSSCPAALGLAPLTVVAITVLAALIPPVHSQLPGSCGGNKCGGSGSSLCECTLDCKFLGTCCADFDALCFNAPAPSIPEYDSCKGFCGYWTDTCFCDTQCTFYQVRGGRGCVDE